MARAPARRISHFGDRPADGFLPAEALSCPVPPCPGARKPPVLMVRSSSIRICKSPSLGAPHPSAAQAMRDLGYYHTFGSHSNEPIIRLAERVLTLFREKSGAGHLSKVFFGTSGSDANDTNFKLVRYYNNLLGRPQKKKVISRLGSYHGLTYAAGSLTGIAAFHKAFDLPIEGVLHTSCPHFYRFAEKGEDEEA